MNRWLFALSPILLMLFFVPMDADAERLLLSGSGEIEKRFTTGDSEFELIFNTIPTEKRILLEFESGYITIDGDQHFINPNVMLRDFDERQKFRFAGMLDNGNLFWIYGDRDGTNYELFGKMVTANNIFDIQYAGAIQSLDVQPADVVSVPESEVDVEYTPKMAFDYRVEDPTFIQEDLQIIMKVYDENLAPGGLQNRVHNLEGVKVHVTLEQERKEVVVVNERTAFEQIVEGDWKVLETFEGQTNRLGDYRGSTFMASGEFEPKQFMRITIVATYLDQEVTEQFTIWIDQVGHK